MNDLKSYIEFYQGTLPLIISVSHGGVKKFEKLPDRTNGIIGIDKKTNELAYNLIESIKNIFISSKNKVECPSYVISNIHRSKVDLNRPKLEAFEDGSKVAEIIYDHFHNKIIEFISYNLKSFNWSLLIDIHGFEKHKRPEGYRDVELILGSNNLKSMYSTPLPKRDWKRSFRGKIIKKFNELQIPIAPGHHLRREYVLTGGYITQEYGTSKIPNSQAIQIEFSDKIRLVDRELRKNVIQTLGEILYQEIEERLKI